MNLDQLIACLNEVRERHGGGLAVMIGQRNPGNPEFWSGIDVERSTINEAVSLDPILTLFKQTPTKSGWLWFEFPIEGIEHKKRRPRVKNVNAGQPISLAPSDPKAVVNELNENGLDDDVFQFDRK